jgi:hypothetical protein
MPLCDAHIRSHSTRIQHRGWFSVTPDVRAFLCRFGEVLVTLARAFPNCEFHGYDISAKSLAAAQDRQAVHPHPTFATVLQLNVLLSALTWQGAANRCDDDFTALH